MYRDDDDACEPDRADAPLVETSVVSRHPCGAATAAARVQLGAPATSRCAVSGLISLIRHDGRRL
jgi:hypothetical protein